MTEAPPRYRCLRLLSLALPAQVALLAGPVALVVGIGGLISWRVILFMAMVSGWLIAESVLAFRDQRVPLTDDALRGFAGTSALAILATFWMGLADTASTSTSVSGLWTAVGAIVMTLGAALRCLAIAGLGRFFLNDVALLPGQPLVTGGVFGWLRHPSEMGNILLGVGGPLVLGSLLGTAFGAILVSSAAVHRARLEDRMLRRHHLEAFVRYAREVGAFVPHARRVLRARNIPTSVGG